MQLRDVDGILPLSCACFLLSYIESISAARTLAAKNNYEIDPRQELLALGAANLAVGFGQGFPVAGGLSQSAVNDKAGARTPLAVLFASLTLAGCLLFLTGLLANLPTVVLAAIVLVAVRGLIDLKALRHLWHVSRFEFKISMVALVGVLLLGILKGVLVAAIASLLMLIAGVAHPHVAFLGRIAGTRRYSDLERHPDNEVLEGIVIFRVESSLLYFNADYVRQVVWDRIEATPQLKARDRRPFRLADRSMWPVRGCSLRCMRILQNVKSHCGLLEPMRKFATCCAPKHWKIESAILAGTCRSIKRSRNFKKAPDRASIECKGVGSLAQWSN